MIEFQQVSKGFGAQQILHDASFRIGPGERVGIVGPNGAGKSTLFHLIAGDMSPDGGSVSLPKKSRLGYLHQELDRSGTEMSLIEFGESGFPEIGRIQGRIDALESDLHAAVGDDRERLLRKLGELQTRFESLHGYDVKNRAETAFTALGFDPATFHNPVQSFSGGWQMRAELVRATVSNPEILLMDEPSNYLDIPAVEWLQRYLKEFRGTLVLISHDRYLLNSLTTATLEVANAEVTRYKGNYDYYSQEREARVEQKMAAHKNQERKRQQAERFIDRFRSKNTKAALVQSMIKKVEKMEQIAVPQAVKTTGRIRLAAPERCGNEVARLDDVGFAYDKENWVLRRVAFSVMRGDRTALVGLNGTGKTTLLKLLSGKLTPEEGRVVIGHKVQPGYQSQEHTDTMDDRLSVFQTVRQANADASEQQVRTLLGGFGFSGDLVEKPVSVLSGGEKVRLAFARLLVNPPNFLLLDEPTTHLDIAAREALEDALREFQGTLCIVSHDIEFVRQVATTIVAMTPPGITTYVGGYDYYREKVAQQSAAHAAVSPQPTRTVSQRQMSKRERATLIQEFSRRRRQIDTPLKKAERQTEQLESEQAELLTALSPDAPAPDHERINRRLGEIQDKLNFANRTWEACMIELDELQTERAEALGAAED